MRYFGDIFTTSYEVEAETMMRSEGNGAFNNSNDNLTREKNYLWPAGKVHPSLGFNLHFKPYTPESQLIEEGPVLLLLRDFWRGCDEVVLAVFDGRLFVMGKNVVHKKHIAGWLQQPTCGPSHSISIS